jgi:DMSO/TMAO reductase YedYZ heme-binding membrane subunit
VIASFVRCVWQLGEWKDNGISNLAGVIAMLAGTVMWVTSVPLMRKRFFNVFYSMHHLYLVYFAFSVWHVGWSQAGEFLGAIFLFFVDRFLRFVQSRRPVTGVPARLLPSGVIELSIPTHAGMNNTKLPQQHA